MTESITLELPSDVVARARAEGARTGRGAEAVLADWTTAPIDSLSNAEILAWCDAQMPDEEQREMSDLLWKQREQQIDPEERPRLRELLANYRSGLVRKAEAFRVAVARGLLPPLGEA